jgi:hypothetical protein
MAKLSELIEKHRLAGTLDQTQFHHKAWEKLDRKERVYRRLRVVEGNHLQGLWVAIEDRLMIGIVRPEAAINFDDVIGQEQMKVVAIEHHDVLKSTNHDQLVLDDRWMASRLGTLPKRILSLEIGRALKKRAECGIAPIPAIPA